MPTNTDRLSWRRVLFLPHSKHFSSIDQLMSRTTWSKQSHINKQLSKQQTNSSEMKKIGKKAIKRATIAQRAVFIKRAVFISEYFPKLTENLSACNLIFVNLELQVTPTKMSELCQTNYVQLCWSLVKHYEINYCMLLQNLLWTLIKHNSTNKRKCIPSYAFLLSGMMSERLEIDFKGPRKIY